jgi:YkoY family integral membrane protein
LPPKEQKHALHWGIAGAYLFRFVAIGLGVLLVKLWWVKAIGGAYLLWMALKYFYGMYFSPDENHDNVPDNVQKGLFATILTVEMMDIAFSADSVLAAFGVSQSAWVLLIGGMLGILCMRYAAQIFVKLLEKVPELEAAAYLLIMLIGSKMIMSLEHCKLPYCNVEFNGPGIHMGEWTFVGAMVAIFGGTLIINYLKNNKIAQGVGGIR